MSKCSRRWSPVTGSDYRGKRVFDLVALAVLTVPALVAGAGCAAAMKLTSPGPVLFRQQRAGLRGLPFTMLKFRTMVDGDNPLFPDPARITPVGGWLRRLSLDELPQLWNVLRGEMSVVGPRPALEYQVERYDEGQRRRLLVRPGLTGLAQVRGRNTLSWAERIELDLAYVAHQSLLLDIKVLFLTILPVIRGTGVGGHPIDDPLATPR